MASHAARLTELEAQRAALMTQVYALDGAITEVRKAIKKQASLKERAALLGSSSEEEEAVEAEAVEAQAVEAQAVEAQPVEADAEDVQAVEAQAVEAQAVEAQAVEAQAVEAQAVEADAEDVQAVVAEAVVAVAAVAVGGAEIQFYIAEDFAPFTIGTLPKHACRACFRGFRGMIPGNHGQRPLGSCLLWTEEGPPLPGRPCKQPRV
jgi:hypothetical protein